MRTGGLSHKYSFLPSLFEETYAWTAAGVLNYLAQSKMSSENHRGLGEHEVGLA